MFIRNHLEYFLANQKAMKVLSHEDEALKNSSAPRSRHQARVLPHLPGAGGRLLRRQKGQGFNGEFSSRIAVLSLFGMMNWIYTWHNPRVDAAPEPGPPDGRHFSARAAARAHPITPALRPEQVTVNEVCQSSRSRALWGARRGRNHRTRTTLRVIQYLSDREPTKELRMATTTETQRQTAHPVPHRRRRGRHRP